MKHPLPKSKEEKADAYLKAMLEIKARFKLISEAAKTDWPDNLKLEICYLQFRHICELITVGALIIQGDYAGDLGSQFAPGPIFKKLQSKYGMGFPQPFNISKNDAKINLSLNSVAGAMTKNEMIDLWNRSGDKLHRLKVSKFFKSYEDGVDQPKIEEIKSFIVKLQTLLEKHAHAMHTPKALVLIAMNPDGVAPSSAFMDFKEDGLDVHTFTAEGKTGFFH